jgi:hypothetical protein
MVNVLDVKETLQKFIRLDDTPKNLVETLKKLTKMRSVVNDRLLKVDKDLAVLRKIFAQHDEQQQKCKQ